LRPNSLGALRAFSRSCGLRLCGSVSRIRSCPARANAAAPRQPVAAPVTDTVEARERTARLLVLRFDLADHRLGPFVEGGNDLIGVLFRAVKSHAADHEIDDFMTGPRSHPG
jgi:hypothetical protein